MPKEFRKIEIDMWKTGKLKAKTFGFKKQEEFRSKSRQFTKEMDIIGEIKEKGKDHGTIGIREDIINDRIVLKIFNGSMHWIGSLEESISREVIHSFVLGHKFPSLLLVISRYDYVVVLEKNEGGFGKKEIYHFTIFDDERVAYWFVLEKKRIAVGDDWEIKNLQKKVVAILDGKKFDVGGQWNLKIFNESLSKNKAFVNTLLLFGAFRKYENDVKNRIKQTLTEIKKGKSKKIQREEISMYENPRSVN